MTKKFHTSLCADTQLKYKIIDTIYWRIAIRKYDSYAREINMHKRFFSKQMNEFFIRLETKI